MNNDFQNKLFNYEAPPPAGVWEKIADALETPDGYAQRLAGYEEPPSPAVWRRLETTLNESATPAKVVPFLIRYKNPLRYIAAAGVIVVALVTVTLITRHTEAGSLAGKIERMPPLQRPASENRAVVTATIGRSATIKTEGGNEEKTFVASIKRTLAYIKPQKILPKLSFSRRFIPRKVTGESVADFSAQEAFMVYSDGNGNAMRLPKKLFSLVNCEDGDETCKHRIQTLRQKLSANVSPSDFTGMLDLLRQLQ